MPQDPYLIGELWTWLEEYLQRLALLQILEECYERKSVLVTSQLLVSKWYEYITEPTIAEAIIDRLCANAHRTELKGESLRRKAQKEN